MSGGATPEPVPPEATTIEVRGGPGGVRAHLDDLGRLGTILSAAGAELGHQATRLGRAAASPELLASAAFSPSTLVPVERAAVATLAGRHGLPGLAVAAEGLGASLRLAVAAYSGAEAGASAAIGAARLGVGAGVGLALGAGAGAGAAITVAGGAAVVATAPTSVPTVAAAATWLAGAGAGEGEGEGVRGVERWAGRAVSATADALLRLLVEHPGTTEHLVSGAPGALTGLATAGSTALGGLVAGRIVGTVASGGSAVGGGVDVLLEVGRRPGWTCEPSGLRVTGRSDVAVSVEPSAAGLLSLVPEGAAARVVRVAAPRGTAWVVAVPGTRAWPARPGAEPFDGVGNLRLVAGERTASREAVLQAMDDAGVGPREPVVLVGYSQGGLVAASLAADPAVRRRFSVSHVLTAGSPVASARIPDDVAVLSLEHRRDVVPHLEGAANPDRPRWWTVRTDRPSTAGGGAAALLDQHDLAGYRATAVLADGAAGVDGWRSSLRDVLGAAARPGAGLDVWAERGAGPCRP